MAAAQSHFFRGSRGDRRRGGGSPYSPNAYGHVIGHAYALLPITNKLWSSCVIGWSEASPVIYLRFVFTCIPMPGRPCCIQKVPLVMLLSLKIAFYYCSSFLIRFWVYFLGLIVFSLLCLPGARNPANVINYSAYVNDSLIIT
jgi:hypothetical protein